MNLNAKRAAFRLRAMSREFYPVTLRKTSPGSGTYFCQGYTQSEPVCKWSDSAAGAVNALWDELYERGLVG